MDTHPSHMRLIAQQSLEELRRKQQKARRKSGEWTQEDIDYAKRAVRELGIIGLLR